MIAPALCYSAPWPHSPCRAVILYNRTACGRGMLSIVLTSPIHFRALLELHSIAKHVSNAYLILCVDHLTECD
jgi:hypothetical protein